MEPPSDRSAAALVDRALQTPRGNVVAGSLLIVASVAFLGLVRAYGHLLITGDGIESLWLPLFMALVSVPVLGGITLLLAGAGLGFPNGLRAGVATYAVLGSFFFLVGIPGYVGALRPPVGPFWPFFVLWFHPCLAGFGLWSCPG